MILLAALPGIAPAALTPDAKDSMMFWNVANEGFMYPEGTGTLTRNNWGADIVIPSGTSREFITPLTVPSHVNKRACVIHYVYVYWEAPVTCQINRVIAETGGGYGVTLTPTIPGPGGPYQQVTIDLNQPLLVRRGLSVQWRIYNSGGSSATVHLFAVGTKVKYKV